jgi:hypothetical protein
MSNGNLAILRLLPYSIKKRLFNSLKAEFNPTKKRIFSYPATDNNFPICRFSTVYNQRGFARIINLRYKSKEMFAIMFLVQNYCVINGISLSDDNLLLIYNECKDKDQYLLFNDGTFSHGHAIQHYVLKKFNVKCQLRFLYDITAKIKTVIYTQGILLTIENVEEIFCKYFREYYKPKILHGVRAELQPAAKFKASSSQ